MTRPDHAGGRDVQGRVRQHAGRRRLRRGGAAGAAAARRRPDPPRLEEDRRSDRAAGPRRLRGRPARPRRFRMGRGRRLCVLRFRRRRARAGRYAGRAQRRAAGRWSAPRSAASRRCWRRAGRIGRRTMAVFSALVLVDITPRVDLDGVAKVQGFMRAHAKRGLRLDRRGRRRGRRLSAAPAAAALPRGAEEEPAAASRRPLALALGPAVPRRQPPDRPGRPARSSRRWSMPRSSITHPDAAGARRLLRTGAGGARQGFPRSWCRTPAMSMSAAPATWSPATATISSQTPSRASCRSLKTAA